MNRTIMIIIVAVIGGGNMLIVAMPVMITSLGGCLPPSHPAASGIVRQYFLA